MNINERIIIAIAIVKQFLFIKTNRKLELDAYNFYMSSGDFD